MHTNLTFRLATIEDLPEIISMLADDTYGATRENNTSIVSEKYLNAFKKIQEDPNQELIVATINENKVASFQLTFIQYLNFEGTLRAQIEAVRTHSDYRGQGIGTNVLNYAINRAKEKGCQMIQLTSDKRRTEAIKFYEKLGFKASHEGFKLKLD
ncbi:GNAT family N-acetyltransferase [Flavobacterium sp. AC]|uniref:GNAT family N-acetyltransferase n=1 Tax=Flavobacterium azizsancarii TaxID=2961580 RepID=A0ABT4W9W7_9FLAO|nr:GNAT family N-acetyltransferase [Flavobacterium azizsancarii]MDA6069344.1 GNAT family N-acetyltransferase [Flavobacterium azizsancarii]